MLYRCNTQPLTIMTTVVNTEALLFALEDAQTGSELLEIIDAFVAENNG